MAQKEGLYTTLIEKCIQRLENDVVLLDTQYRMNEVIMGFSNEQFYKGALQADITVKNHTLGFGNEFALEFIDTAGCSYDEKTGRGSYEVHREYFRHKVAIFADRLPKGRHTYTIKLLPRYSGVYTVNPARVELMYFPVFYGRTGLKEVRIK